MSINNTIKDVVERIASCVLRDGVDIRDVLEGLAEVDWVVALDAERARRAERQEWLDNEESECQGCFVLIKNKDSYALRSRSISPDLPPYSRFDGWYCSSCYEAAKRELLNHYSRECSICGLSFYVKREDSGKRFCDVHSTEENQREVDRVLNNNRRTFNLGLAADLTVQEWLQILQFYNNRCAYCGGLWTDLEHVVPVAEGGGTTRNNVVPACRTCNTEKRSRNLQPIQR